MSRRVDPNRDDLFLEVVRLMSEEGRSLRQASASLGLAESTVRSWLDQIEGAQELYDQARMALLDYHVNEILKIADSPGLEPADKRIRVDARKWIYSKLMPKRFGERMTAEIGGIGGGPLKVIERRIVDPAQGGGDVDPDD